MRADDGEVEFSGLEDVARTHCRAPSKHTPLAVVNAIIASFLKI